MRRELGWVHVRQSGADPRGHDDTHTALTDRDDPRVKAAVDQDGQLFGNVRDKGTPRPFMLMHHGIDDKPPKPEQIDAMKELPTPSDVVTTTNWS